MTISNISEIYKNIENPKVQNRTFFQEKGKNINYKQFSKDIDKLIINFQNQGLKKGDKIILSTKNDYYTSLFFLAFLKYGLVTIFLDPDVQKNRAISIIEKSEPQGFVMDDLLFTSRNIDSDSSCYLLKIKPIAQKKGKLFNRLVKNKINQNKKPDNSFPSILSNITGTPDSLEPISNSDLAYIIFTSGTTNDPKGVMITHQNIFTHLATLTKVYNLNENSRIHNILMLYHADGCIQGPLLTLYNQATWLRPFTFDLAKIGDLFNSIYKYRATHFITVPTVLSFMNKFKEDYEDSFETEDFKHIISVASKLEGKLWLDFEKTFKTEIVNVYGLTETVAGSFFCTIDPKCKKGTIGLPIDCEAKIIKEDNTQANNGEKGILWIRGAHIFNGYLNNLEATDNILQNGWLNTGDIARKDEEGFYNIVGRAKNTINAGGINIYPEQVTEMINTHSDILESICLGIENNEFGEVLVAALVLKPSIQLGKSELIDFLRPLLEQNQIPKYFFFFDELPKGISGKIQTNEVLKLITEKNNVEIDNEGQQNLQKSIKKAASQAFGVSITKISMDDSSNSLDGWDSMGHLDFITNLEKIFNLQISTSEMMTMNSITASERILAKKLDV